MVASCGGLGEGDCGGRLYWVVCVGSPAERVSAGVAGAQFGDGIAKRMWAAYLKLLFN